MHGGVLMGVMEQREFELQAAESRYVYDSNVGR